MVSGPCRQFAIAHGAQVAAQGLLADRHAIFAEQPLDQIDDPPANHPMRSRDRTLFDDSRQRLFVLSSEHRTRARCLAIEQPVGPARVEAQHPVPNRLQAHAADICRRVPRTTIVYHRQRQQPANLVRIPAQTRQPSKTSSVEIVPQNNR